MAEKVDSDGAKRSRVVPAARVRADVIAYLRGVMNDAAAAPERRDRAASRLVALLGDPAAVGGGRGGSAAGGGRSAPKAKGLKEQRVDDAHSVLEQGSRFTPGAPPRLN